MEKYAGKRQMVPFGHNQVASMLWNRNAYSIAYFSIFALAFSPWWWWNGTTKACCREV